MNPTALKEFAETVLFNFARSLLYDENNPIKKSTLPEQKDLKKAISKKLDDYLDEIYG